MYKTVNFVSCVGVKLGLTPREGNGLKVCENNAQGRICVKESDMNMVKVHEQDLHDLYSSASNIKW
jgi:hypothetical protein